MYTKDILYLLRLLQTSKHSGILFVKPPEQIASSWQGQFYIEKGALLSCLVCNTTDGQVLLSNDKAIRWLTSQGRLEWHLEEDAQLPDSLRPSLPQREEAKRGQRHNPEIQPSPAWKKQLGGIPQRTQQGKNVSVNAFASRDHRQVFALVDGRRTIEEIVRLLHKSPTSIIYVLQDLQAAGLII